MVLSVGGTLLSTAVDSYIYHQFIGISVESQDATVSVHYLTQLNHYSDVHEAGIQFGILTCDCTSSLLFSLAKKEKNDLLTNQGIFGPRFPRVLQMRTIEERRR